MSVPDPSESSSMSESVLVKDLDVLGVQQSASRELFLKDNIAIRTELSPEQVNAMARMRFIYRYLSGRYSVEENTRLLLLDLQTMSVSLKRKSRTEFVESQKIANAAASSESPMMDKLFGAKK